MFLLASNILFNKTVSLMDFDVIFSMLSLEFTNSLNFGNISKNLPKITEIFHLQPKMDFY